MCLLLRVSGSQTSALSGNPLWAGFWRALDRCWYRPDRQDPPAVLRWMWWICACSCSSAAAGWRACSCSPLWSSPSSSPAADAKA